MNTHDLLERLLTTNQQTAIAAQETTSPTQNLASNQDETSNHETALAEVGATTAVNSVAELLLGSHTERRIAGPAEKLGTIEAFGSFGNRVHSDWRKKTGEPAQGRSVDKLVGPDVRDRCLSLIAAMVASAKSDGHIDPSELEFIRLRIDQREMDEDQSTYLLNELAKPLDIREIASGATSTQAAVEIYVASLLFADPSQPVERKFLDDLGAELDLSSEFLEALEAEAFAS